MQNKKSMDYKRILLLFAIALALVFGLALTGCSDDEPGTPSGSLGNELKIDGEQVYNDDGSEYTGTTTFTHTTDSDTNIVTLVSLGLTNVTVTNGKVSFTFGAPNASALTPASNKYSVAADPADVKVFIFGACNDNGGGSVHYLSRGDDDDSDGEIDYVYADKAAKIIGDDSGDSYNIALSQGWNAVIHTDIDHDEYKSGKPKNQKWTFSED